MRLTTRTRRTPAIGAAAAAMSLAFAPVAGAHDVVVGGDPADGATVSEFPHHVTLEFSAIPRDTFNTFAISKVDGGQVLYSHEPTVDGRNLSLDIPGDINPGPGQYHIGFQITSSDGHSTKGMTTFTVANGGEQGQQGQQPPSTSEDKKKLSSTWSWIIAIAAVLAAGSVAAIVMSKNKHKE